MITRAGVKVLDFGLAKLTLDETITLTNAVMGTPAYMAPEQRSGKECDARTDIFALGLVLYEMAVGQRVVQGQTSQTDHLTERLGHVITRCLAQEPEERWQAASDVRHELAWCLKTPPTSASTPPRGLSARWIAVSLLLVTLGIGLGWTIGHSRRAAVEIRPIRLAINPPSGAELRGNFAISPDGRLLVFSARSAGADGLWLRPLNSRAATQLAGTEGATDPFWSPDNRSIAFFAAGKLKRLDIRGGSPTVICDVGQGRGGTWNAEGTILFNSVNDGPILRVAAAGGQPVAITQLDTVHQENSHRWPFFLPDGRRFLYYVRSTNREGGPGTEGVYLASLDRPQQSSLLIRSTSNAIYAPSESGGAGYLLWLQESNAMAQQFDAAGGHLLGNAVPAAEMVSFSLPARLGQIAVSNEGTLVYRGASTRQYQLTWVNRDGKPVGTIGPPDLYEGLRISPDGTRIAVSRASPVSGFTQLALMETTRGIATPLVSDSFGAVWSPDGRHVAYTGSPGGSPNVYARAVAGAGEPERLTNSQGSQGVHDWSSDGRFLLYNENVNDPSNPAGSDLWILPLTGDRKPFPFLKTPFRENRGQFSPDGKWIAYTSDEQGRSEIYVQSFPVGGGKWQVSNKGGDYARWRRDGKELLYVGADGTLNAVSVRPSPGSLEFASPSALFRIAVPVGNGSSYPFDIAPDGRTLVLAPAGEQGDSSLMIWLHWQADLRR
jgi:Tol biopolymer transport system component